MGKGKVFSSPTGENNLGEGPQETILFSSLRHGPHLTTALISQPLNLLYNFPQLFWIDKHVPKDLVLGKACDAVKYTI